MSCEDNMEDLRRENGELQCRRSDMLIKIQDAERKGKTPTHEVKLWLERVIKLQDEVTEMESNFREMLRCLGDYSPNVLSGYRLSKRAEKLINDAKDMKDRMPQEIASELVSNHYVEWPTSNLVVGMDAAFEQLQRLTEDDSVSTIGIYGMGGIGKTELLKKFYNQPHLRKTYHMIWIDMIGCQSVEDAQKSLAKGLGLIWKETENQDARARRIYDFLNKKAFVLVLDNVWTTVDVNEVGIPVVTRQAKSKIILATRIENVCDSMEATKIRVKCLEWKDAWRLFVRKAGKNLIESDPMIRRYAATLVKKCGGLPLALITIGRAMASKKRPKLWKHAITTLDKKPLEIQGMEVVLSSLKRSYDNLEYDKLRTCFLYCALHQDSTRPSKMWILHYCIGERDIADRLYDEDEVFNEVYNLLDVLKGASMLEPGQSSDKVKVHPMIHVLALWLEGGGNDQEKKWLIQFKKGLTEVPEVDEWKGVERVSLMHNRIKALSTEWPNSPCLKALLLYRNPLVNICNGFFLSMKNLKVLDMSNTDIEEVPAEIGELVQLQYLDVSRTEIKSLPKELENLIRLRYLWLQVTPKLKRIPEGLIARLSELQYLEMYSSYGFSLGFEELQCVKRLKGLGISIESAIALQKLAECRRLADCTQKLEIRLSPGLTTLSTETLRIDFTYLNWLRLFQCNDLEELEISISGRNLKRLVLESLPKAKITWKSGCCQNLTYIRLEGCEEVRQLIHCDDKSNEGEEEERLREINILPCLWKLHLFDLPKLESLTCGKRTLAFPSLEAIRVKNCPKLKKLPLNATKLQHISGKKSWWDGLEWADGDNIRSKFESMFTESDI